MIAVNNHNNTINYERQALLAGNNLKGNRCGYIPSDLLKNYTDTLLYPRKSLHSLNLACENFSLVMKDDMSFEYPLPRNKEQLWYSKILKKLFHHDNGRRVRGEKKQAIQCCLYALFNRIDLLSGIFGKRDLSNDKINPYDYGYLVHLTGLSYNRVRKAMAWLREAGAIFMRQETYQIGLYYKTSSVTIQINPAIFSQLDVEEEYFTDLNRIQQKIDKKKKKKKRNLIPILYCKKMKPADALQSLKSLLGIKPSSKKATGPP